MPDHLAAGALSPGREIAVRVDQTLLQDTTGIMSQSPNRQPELNAT
jgi:hypothetical protein